MIAGMLVVVVAVLVSPRLWAADESKEKELREGLAARIQDLGLTDAQEAKIADIRKECHNKIQESAKELVAAVKEEVDKVQEVLTAEQKEKLKELKAERKEQRREGLAERIAHLRSLGLTADERAKIEAIRKEYHPKMVKAMEGLKGILSDEQKKAREEGLKAVKKGSEILAALNLTDEQKQKVAAIAKEVRTVATEELEKIKDVLTEGQQAKLEELKDERKEHVRDRRAHRIANFKDLNLTEEQKTKLGEIRKEYRPKVHEAGNKLRAAAKEGVEAILVIIKG
jgi:Spy/CpxP family protein refolding chaperone